MACYGAWFGCWTAAPRHQPAFDGAEANPLDTQTLKDFLMMINLSFELGVVLWFLFWRRLRLGFGAAFGSCFGSCGFGANRSGSFRQSWLSTRKNRCVEVPSFNVSF